MRKIAANNKKPKDRKPYILDFASLTTLTILDVRQSKGSTMLLIWSRRHKGKQREGVYYAEKFGQVLDSSLNQTICILTSQAGVSYNIGTLVFSEQNIWGVSHANYWI